MQEWNDKFQAGVDLISSTFKQQQEIFKRDIKKQQAVIENITKQKQNLESQNHKLLTKLAEMERTILTLKQDNQNISNSYNNLSVRFATLKKSASQLEAFRKSIVSMIQNNPVNMTLQSIDLPSDQHSDLDHSEYIEPNTKPHMNNYKESEETSKDFASQISSELVSEDIVKMQHLPPSKNSLVKQFEAEALRLSQRTDRDLSHDTLRAAQTASQATLSNNDKTYDEQQKEFQDIEKSVYLGLGLTSNGSYMVDTHPNAEQSYFAETFDNPNEDGNEKGDILPSDFLEANKYKWEINEKITRVLERNNTMNNIDHDVPTSSFDISPKALQTRDATLDTAVLYKKIQSALTPGQFDDFASVIGSFNAGEISPNETIHEIKSLIADNYLFDQMKSLIYEASK
ncbi:hypothetical protein HDV04_000248 [Boothiomyces sp. JEL0838]|nr:hypothetical protein HDV04_000248 [Boothiomyces sp. JEL0838]